MLLHLRMLALSVRHVPGSVSRGLSPATSVMTSPSTNLSSATWSAAVAQRRDDINQICDIPIAGLVADIPISPVKQMQPLDEEDLCDRHVCNDDPGADGLEEEPDDELATAMMEAQAEEDNEEKSPLWLIGWTVFPAIKKASDKQKMNSI